MRYLKHCTTHADALLVERGLIFSTESFDSSPLCEHYVLSVLNNEHFSADFSRNYQAQQHCICDQEHMFKYENSHLIRNYDRRFCQHFQTVFNTSQLKIKSISNKNRQNSIKHHVEGSQVAPSLSFLAIHVPLKAELLSRNCEVPQNVFCHNMFSKRHEVSYFFLLQKPFPDFCDSQKNIIYLTITSTIAASVPKARQQVPTITFE